MSTTDTKADEPQVDESPPTPEELEAMLAELKATMEANHEGYKAYEKAHNAQREAAKKRQGTAEFKKVKDDNREAHKVYWAAYAKSLKLRRAYGDLAK